MKTQTKTVFSLYAYDLFGIEELESITYGSIRANGDFENVKLASQNLRIDFAWSELELTNDRTGFVKKV